MKTSIAAGLLILVFLSGCSESSERSIAIGSPPKTPPTFTQVGNRRSARDVVNRLRAANLSLSDKSFVAADHMAPFGIEHMLTIFSVEGQDLSIYQFDDSWLAQRAAAKLPALDLAVDYIQMDNLIVVVPSGEQGDRLLSVLR